MTAPLSGRCALVTGSTAGLGAAIASRLAGAGCGVVLNGFGEATAIERQRAELEACHGVSAIHHPADLRRPDDIAAMVAAAETTFGGIDILVNNAVVRHFAAVDAFPPERWDEALAVNLSAAFHTVRLAVPGMRRRGWGRIVNIASVYSFGAVAGRVDYVTTKTALLGFTRAVALDVVGDGVTCNAVCPGTLETPPITARIAALAAEDGVTREEAERRYLADRQPTRRFVAADNVADLIVFLCGPSAADITGTALPIDGGWTAR